MCQMDIYLYVWSDDQYLLQALEASDMDETQGSDSQDAAAECK